MRVKLLGVLMLALLCLNTYAGTITTSVTSLPSFGNVYVFNSSTTQYYIVNASSLTAPLEVTAPAGFEVSLTYKFGYSGKVVVTPVSGSITNKFIYVRFSPSGVGAVSGSVSNVSVGSTTVNVSITATATAWAIPSSYYSTVNTQRGAALKTVLYNKISVGTSAVGYGGLWTAYPNTDAQFNGKVWDIYSTRFDGNSPYEFTYFLNQDSGSGGSNEGERYNREHSFPQSWFNNATPMVSDIHHIFPTDKKVNNLHSNYAYGKVSAPTNTTLIGCKLGPNSYPGSSGTAFEIVDEYKGDIARAYLYMATRYENLIASWQGNGNANDVLDGTSYPAYDAWLVNMLIEWHNLDPVSDKEIKRNNAIYAIQNNRNPYVDSPQFVAKIWGGALPAEPTVGASNLTITNISNTSVKLSWTSGNGFRRLVIVKPTSTVNGLPIDTVNYLANASYTSAPQTSSGNYIVYNGTGSSVTITNLLAGVNYYYAVVEYNGWYNTTNYFSSGASTINAVTLPVTWLNFDGKRIKSDVELTWQTASEKNNLGFWVERSLDGKTFNTIGFVRGHLNTNTVSTYRFMDEQTEPNTALFYRLKQTDVDGRYEYSNIITITHELEMVEPLFYPNPVQHQLNISLNEPIGTSVSYMITDLTGKLIKQNHEQVQSKERAITISTNDLDVGVYFVQIEYNNRNYRYKFIKN